MKFIEIIQSSLLLLLSYESITLVDSYDDSSCAYFTSHVVATPLLECSSVSIPNGNGGDPTQYSWNFECDSAGNIECNYFMGDTKCSEDKKAGSTLIDTLAGEVQCIGSGFNCHTVDITISGFTDPSTCDDENDFTTYSFVIEECIPSTIGDAISSAKMSCDNEKLYFEYYAATSDCTGDGETYTYEYFNDLDGCWDIKCGLHRQEGGGTYVVNDNI